MMDFNLDKNQKAGAIGSGLAVVLIIILLLTLSLKPPFPPPPQLGVEVNLGSSDVGSGDIQPITPQEVNQTKPKQSSVASEEKVATQDTEKSINLSSEDKKSTQQSQTVEEEPEPEIDERFTFKNKNRTGGSEGNDNESGDKGQLGGDPNADDYVGGGPPGGISYSLVGREAKDLPKPREDHSEEGRVVVKIWVNRNGQVTKAQIRMTGTTTTSSDLQERALRAARMAKFNVKSNAPETQVGTIAYDFTLKN
jgi:TonB family protein